MNKYERIQYVRRLNLNTENSIAVRKQSDLYRQFINERKYFSVRTCYWDETGIDEKKVINTPHHPVVTKRQLFKLAPKLFKRKLTLIVADVIDPKDALFAGCALKDKHHFWIEIAYGPVTVRRVTHECVIDFSKKVGLHTKIKANECEFYEELNICLDYFRKVMLSHIIFEFSWYKKHIGWNNEHFVCWEITSDGSEDAPSHLRVKER
jgi:hypothetical protein